MATIQFGRIGLDASFGNAVTGYQETSTYDEGRQVTFSGLVKTSTLADTIALRTEVPALSGQIVPVIWSFDSTLNGYYAISETSIDASAQSGSYVSGGLFGFTVTAKLVGSDADVEFESKMIGAVLDNDKGVTDAESAPYLAVPSGGYAFEQGTLSPTLLNRTSADGVVPVYTDIVRTPYPTWSVAVADYYNGAATVTSDGYVRQGTHAANPSDWSLSNGLVRVSPNGTSGRLDVEHYDGSQWDAAVAWNVQFDAVEVGEWDAIAILSNRPEAATVRLTRAKTSVGRHTLDLKLRRGSRFVEGYLSTSTSGTLKVGLNAGSAGTAITPTGAASAVGVRSNTSVNGNRPAIGTANATPAAGDTSVSEAATTTMDFFVGSEVNYTASSGDTAPDLCLQYLGHISEAVRTVRR